MTEINFHFNAPNKLEHALKVLRKGHRLGAKIVAVAPAELIAGLDQGLWVHFVQEFIPHARLSAAPEVMGRSPVLLATPADDLKASPHHEVLVSLCDEVVNGFGAFERVIEIVSTQDDDRQRARARWKNYADRGFAIERLDLAQAKESA